MAVTERLAKWKNVTSVNTSGFYLSALFILGVVLVSEVLFGIFTIYCQGASSKL